MSAKKSLKSARECLGAKEYSEVIQHCKAALREDPDCYDAFLYIGKALYHLGEFEKAELSYQRATEKSDKATAAWQGLSELYHATQQWAKAVEADQTLVNLAHRGDPALAPKLPALARRLGEAHLAAGQLEEAEVALRDALGACDMNLQDKLPVLALLADVQLKEDVLETEVKVQAKLQQKIKEAGGDASKVCEDAVRSSVLSELADEALELDCDHATPTLKDIVCHTPPTPQYVRFHDMYLRKLRQAVNVAAPGSMDRHNRRVAVLEVCRLMMEGRCAASPEVCEGCASPYAFETALRLLEIEEEIVGGRMPRTTSAGEFGALLPRSGSQAFSGVTSPRSGLATPTAAAAASVSNLFSPGPGSFFGGSLANAARVGSLGALGDAFQGGLRSGALTPLESTASGVLPLAPSTPKRDLSAARLTELVLHPMAAATAAAGATMAQQERESFSQLAAEASAPHTAATGTTANGTPGFITPVGSVGGAMAVMGGYVPGGGAGSLMPGGLSSLNLGPPAIMSRHSSTDLLAASPRLSGTPLALTPKAMMAPLAAPIIMADREAIARKLMHAFPWNPTAQVHLAMCLQRREAYMDSKAATIRLQCGYQGPDVTDLSCNTLAQRLRAERSRQLARRAWLVNTLAKGLSAGAPVVSAMIGLAELRLESGDAVGALQAAKMGIKFVFDRSKIGKERARHAALMLNLLAAQALLASGQVTDAGRIFVRLAGRVNEGEVRFGSEAVGLPATSIRQQAIRGLAQVALAQGDTCQALHHYGELVSKALMGRGSAEHWAYAEYGWLLFQEGNVDAGRYQLETALDVYQRQTGLMGSEAVAAGYHYKLGRIYWALGGELRSEREYCHAQLLDAALEEGPQQAEAFEWLGHWHSQVAGDELRARKCYQRALALDPTLAGAGNALCDLLSARAAAAAAAAAAADGSSPAAAAAAADSQLVLEQQLLEEMLVRAPDAQWARSRLAGLQLQLRQYEAAVGSFQAAIRSSPKSASLWEGLAASYQALGRHASALKSYSRALELDPDRPFCLMSAGALEYMAGAYEAAAARYRAALQLVPQHPAALLGLAEVLLSSACQHVAMGATGAAALELAEAAERATAAVTGVKSAPSGAAATGIAAGGAAAAVGSSCPAAAVAALLTPSPAADGSRSSSVTAAATAPEAAPAECFQYSTNLVTAWKLLGDILLQQHLLQPAAAKASALATQEGYAAAASTATPAPGGAVATALQQLAVRQDLLVKARKAFAHALLLNPSAGELWGDVALCYSHQARLLLELQPPRQQQQQQQQQGTGASFGSDVAAARAAAVSMARGGLRLAPASSWLWGVLAGAAAAAGDPAAAEYGYSRALSLDPKAAMLWVQLGRLYSRYGSAELAEQCYEAARGAEPTLVSVWEGMAATAAAGGSAVGTAAAAAAAEHAVGLGGGPESWLEFAAAGLRRHAPHQSGLLLACASKASAHQPLLLPPTAALAAALESRGQFTSATAALRYCLALLQAGQQQGPEGLAALGLASGFKGQQQPDQGGLTHQLLLIQPVSAAADSLDGLQTVSSVDDVSSALQLALARNLCLSGSYVEAVALYQQLEASGALSWAATAASAATAADGGCGDQSCSWLCYGYAAQQLNQPGLCLRAMKVAVDCAADAAAKLTAVTALLQHDLQQGGLEDGFSLLLEHLPTLSSTTPSLASACTQPWLSLLVAAAAAGKAELQDQVAEVMRQCVLGQQQHIDTAWLEAEQQCIKAAVAAAAGHKQAAVHQLAHAVHTCPWHIHAHVRLANQALATKPRSAPAVYRACPVLLPEVTTNSCNGSSSNSGGGFPHTASNPQQQQQQLAGGYSSSSYSQTLRIADVLESVSSRATALSSQVPAAVAALAGQEVRRLQRLLHALPDSPDLWYCLALAALLQAVGDGQCGHFRKALSCCTSALVRVKQLIQQAEQQQQQSRLAALRPLAVATAAAAAAGQQRSSTASQSPSVSLQACDLQQLKQVQVRLMVGISECHQHSRMPGCHDAAHHWAMDALAAAMATSGPAVATAHRQVGRMLAFEGMTVEAEMAYRQAVAAAGGLESGAQLELAKLLVGQSRQQEAAELLHAIWEGAADALSSGAAAVTAATAASQQQQQHGHSFVEAAALEEALLLGDLGQLESARAAASAGMKLALSAGETAPAAAELATATVALQGAAAVAPADPARKNLLLEARWAASSAAKSGLALPGTAGTSAAGVGAAVLAQVELLRDKPEKAYDAIGMSFGAWVDQAVPAQVLIAAGELSGEVADCAAAVHTAPWLQEGWERLQLAASAQGRPMQQRDAWAE